MQNYTGYFLAGDTFLTAQNTYLRVALQPTCSVAYRTNVLMQIVGYNTASVFSDTPIFTVTNIQSNTTTKVSDPFATNFDF
jgi:hypothetical protein